MAEAVGVQSSWLALVVQHICYHGNEPALFNYWKASVLRAGTAQEVQILILSTQPNPTLVMRWALFSHAVHFYLSCVYFSLPITCCAVTFSLFGILLHTTVASTSLVLLFDSLCRTVYYGLY